MGIESLKSLKSMTRRTIAAGVIAAGGLALLGVSASYATHAGPSTVCDGEAPEFTVGGLTPDFSPAAVLVGGVQVGTLPNDMGDHHYTAPVGTPNTFTVVVAVPTQRQARRHLRQGVPDDGGARRLRDDHHRSRRRSTRTASRPRRPRPRRPRPRPP